MKQINSVLCLNPKPINQIKRDRKKRFTRNSVLKMLAVMEASQSAAGPSNAPQAPAVTPEEQNGNEKDFLSSGRTGRRNALPDILGLIPQHVLNMTPNLDTKKCAGSNLQGQHAVVSSADLSSKLQAMTTKDNDKRDQPGCSKS